MGRGASGIWWVEARDAAEHPIMHKTALTIINDPNQNVRSAEVRNPALEQ